MLVYDFSYWYYVCFCGWFLIYSFSDLMCCFLSLYFWFFVFVSVFYYFDVICFLCSKYVYVESIWFSMCFCICCLFVFVCMSNGVLMNVIFIFCLFSISECLYVCFCACEFMGDCIWGCKCVYNIVFMHVSVWKRER